MVCVCVRFCANVCGCVWVWDRERERERERERVSEYVYSFKTENKGLNHVLWQHWKQKSIWFPLQSSIPSPGGWFEDILTFTSKPRLKTKKSISSCAWGYNEWPKPCSIYCSQTVRNLNAFIRSIPLPLYKCPTPNSCPNHEINNKPTHRFVCTKIFLISLGETLTSLH